MSRLHEFVPSRVRNKIGQESRVSLLNGRDVFSAMKGQHFIIMSCNPRIKHVIPGIMKAAEELDAVIAFELTKTEGGLDGGYTGQTPELFFTTIIEYAERQKFTKPFIIHADHITVQSTSAEEINSAKSLISAQVEAGFTSFALDASFNPLADNIAITADLATPIQAEGYGLEVELGDVPAGEESSLTSLDDVRTFLEGLKARDITPQLLAISNGSKKGNYLDNSLVNIDLEQTRQISEVAASFGLSGLVQHGITGTPLRIVGKLADYGIVKGNIGTLWQNVAHAGLPLDLMDAMRKWSRENRLNIKFATKMFKSDIDSIPEESSRQIYDMAYREAKEFLLAFRAKGSATKIASLIGKPACG